MGNYVITSHYRDFLSLSVIEICRPITLCWDASARLSGDAHTISINAPSNRRDISSQRHTGCTRKRVKLEHSVLK